MLENRVAEYRLRHLHAEGEWPTLPKRRYGGVTFNSLGEVLLREPMNHFDGYHWTFAKGKPDKDEHSVDTALRETLEETGHRPEIIGHIPEVFRGGNVGAANYFYVMLDHGGIVDRTAMDRNGETNDLRWVSREEARRLISETTNSSGRARDLRILDAAYNEFERLTSAATRTAE
jgi:8-oxo-dGTP pyrophosphatase MutT (NUDIX family)